MRDIYNTYFKGIRKDKDQLFYQFLAPAKQARKILLFLVALLVFQTCEELEEVNVNPNQPETVPPSTLLPDIIRSSTNALVDQSFLIGNVAAQLSAKSLRVEVDIYQWNSFSNTWFPLYNSLRDIKNMEQLAQQSGNPNFEAVAVIMRSFIFSILTDAYGDIPYTQAINGKEDNNFFPSYDEQEAIYFGEAGLLAELERAADLIDPSAAPISGDILFDGDLEKWQKFANSLRLRLLFHASAQLDVSQQVAAIIKNEPIMDSNEDNAALEYLEAFPNDFPILSEKIGNFDAVRISESIVSTFKNFRDPRLGRYARPTDASINTPQPEYAGWLNGNENCDSDGSKLGLAYFDYPNHPQADKQADGLLMSYAEVEFMIAEAIQRGWLEGDIDAHYQAGIKSSMDYYQVNYSDFGWENFDDFYQNSGIAFSGQLIDIYRQKWIALFFHGLEPYFEVRRQLHDFDNNWDNFDYLSPTCGNLNDDILPVRFLYPGQEQSLNNDNYREAVNRLGEDSFNARIWLVE